jgi:hypothetical protein
METLLASALLVGPTPTGGGPDVSESTYTGKHYAPRWESWRRCVVWRESRDNPKAANRSSSCTRDLSVLGQSMAALTCLDAATRTPGPSR